MPGETICHRENDFSLDEALSILQNPHQHQVVCDNGRPFWPFPPITSSLDMPAKSVFLLLKLRGRWAIFHVTDPCRACTITLSPRAESRGNRTCGLMRFGPSGV